MQLTTFFYDLAIATVVSAAVIGTPYASPQQNTLVPGTPYALPWASRLGPSASPQTFVSPTLASSIKPYRTVEGGLSPSHQPATSAIYGVSGTQPRFSSNEVPATSQITPQSLRTTVNSPSPTRQSSRATNSPSISPATSTVHNPSPSGLQQVVYWGQMDSERSLAEYCTSNEGIDILILTAIKFWGQGQELTSGHFGADCLNTTQPCKQLGQDVETCQKAGKKIFLGIGGSDGRGTINSQQDAEKVAQNIWDSYGGGTSQNRPLGQTTVDGFDFDLESTGNNPNYKFMINKLRSFFASDARRQYSISAAPQCPIPEPNLSGTINAAKFDMLFIQFYNNPGCSVNTNINFDEWSKSVSTGASRDAKLFIGLLAGPMASHSHPDHHINAAKAANLIKGFKSHKGFGGVMLWDAGTSDSVHEGGCSYSRNVRSILDNGRPC